MSITPLYPQNFRLVGRRVKTMNINLPGNILVFFKMQKCQGCAAFESVFQQLSREENRVGYAVCDLTNARDIISMSHQTKTQINKVPHLILYTNYRPHARFKGEKNIPSLRSFIARALSVAPPQTQQQQFMPQQQNMYGGGGGGGNYPQQHPSSIPQSQYPQQQQQHPQAQMQQQMGGQGQNKVWMPEIGKAPAMTGALKGGPSSTQYAYLNMTEEDDEEKLLLPDQVTPHNEPWTSSYKRIGTMD